MVAKIKIQDGNPIWLSPSIIPSRDTVVSPGSSPALATINVNSTDVYVYVKVENTGTVPLGACSCTNTGQWSGTTIFTGFYTLPNGTTSQSRFGTTFSASPMNNSIAGSGWSVQFGISSSGRRAWDWSPDGKFFAFASSSSNTDWHLSIVTLQPVTRSNGTMVPKGQIIQSASGLFAGPPYWTNAQFGWAASNAVMASGTYTGGNGIVRSLCCPYAPSPGTWGDLISSFPGQIDWTYLVSPCGSAVALVPKRLTTTAPAAYFALVLTTTAQMIQFRKNNVPTSISSTGSTPSITTNQHTALGVRINTGNGTAIENVDDMECAVFGGNVIARVDRVKASTLPSANLGVLPIGTAAIGALPVGSSKWIQVPNQNGWANQSEPHWCLLAQAYTADGTTIPQPWNGQATNPPAFPISMENCSQRNVAINP